jgi:hypothetical protein
MLLIVGEGKITICEAVRMKIRPTIAASRLAICEMFNEKAIENLLPGKNNVLRRK